jgi:hypothetical protein
VSKQSLFLAVYFRPSTHMTSDDFRLYNLSLMTWLLLNQSPDPYTIPMLQVNVIFPAQVLIANPNPN